MKKILLVILLMVGFLGSAQKMSKEFLQGTWETDFHLVEFNKINKKDFKITILLKETNQPIQVLKYAIDRKNLYMETYYEPNDWKSIGKLVIIDDNTMVEDVISDAPGLLIYKRVQN
jgi:hypothetical protein